MSKDTKSDNTCLTSDIENFSSSLFNLSAVCKKPIELGFTAAQVSSDGGLLLLREVESQSGILNAITNCIEEDRHPGYIKHLLSSMLTQRVFQIAAGYEGANDCNTLREDMIFKICADVAPESRKHLSSQTTMSRFENSLLRNELYKIAVASETLRATEYATATMKTIRLRLIKVAAYIKEMKTRIKIEFPKQIPDMEVIANYLGIFNVLRC